MKDVDLPEAFSANWRLSIQGDPCLFIKEIRPTKQQQVQVLIPDITIGLTYVFNKLLQQTGNVAFMEDQQLQMAPFYQTSYILTR